MRKLEVVGIDSIREMFPNLGKTEYTGPKIEVDEYIAKIFSGEDHGIKRCGDETCWTR